MTMMTPAPMDVVFSFDTTGSMSQVLDEVKCRLNDLIQRLQADIPQLKVGIIAHGDYCDRVDFYDIRALDLTDNLADVVTFVSETTGTGGGDIPECYELSLRHARAMTWRTGSRRVFVVIGDAYPHEADYCLNTLNIDWQDELSSLVQKSVRVYGVQYGTDPESVTFFQRLSSESGGQHLRLQDMGDICHAIMAICYREQGPDLFQTYEAEVRADHLTGTLNSGLENVFGKLGNSQTTANCLDSPPILPLSLASPVSSDGSDRRISSDSSDNGSTSSLPAIDGNNNACGATVQPQRKRLASNELTGDGGPAKKAKPDIRKIPTITLPVYNDVPGASTSHVPKSTHGNKKDQVPTKQKKCRQNAATRGKKAGDNSDCKIKKSSYPQRIRRDGISDKNFYFSGLPWSMWHLAVATEVTENCGIWRSLAQRACGRSLWRADLLRYCTAKLENKLRRYSQRVNLPRRSKSQSIVTEGAVFELGVTYPDTRGIRSVWLYATNQRRKRPGVPAVLNKSWYSGLARSIREPLTEAVRAGARVYLRWAVVDNVNTVKKDICSRYNYLWR